MPVEIYSKSLLVFTSFSPLSSQGPLGPKNYWGVRDDYLSSGELRFHNPKDPEHEVVYITDLFENKPKALMEN